MRASSLQPPVQFFSFVSFLLFTFCICKIESEYTTWQRNWPVWYRNIAVSIWTKPQFYLLCKIFIKVCSEVTVPHTCTLSHVKYYFLEALNRLNCNCNEDKCVWYVEDTNSKKLPSRLITYYMQMKCSSEWRVNLCINLFHKV